LCIAFSCVWRKMEMSTEQKKVTEVAVRKKGGIRTMPFIIGDDPLISLYTSNICGDTFQSNQNIMVLISFDTIYCVSEVWFWTIVWEVIIRLWLIWTCFSKRDIWEGCKCGTPCEYDFVPATRVSLWPFNSSYYSISVERLVQFYTHVWCFPFWFLPWTISCYCIGNGHRSCCKLILTIPLYHKARSIRIIFLANNVIYLNHFLYKPKIKN